MSKALALAPRIGYVMKVYPRFSETFIVNEILAHEAAGRQIDIFSLRATRDTHFQDVVARVRSSVTYLSDGTLKAEDFWLALRRATTLPGASAGMAAAGHASAAETHAAIVLAHAARDRGISHLHAHFGSAATTVARIAAAFAGITYSFTAHAKDIFHETVRYDDLERKLADAAATITVSDYNLKYLRRMFGAAADRVRHVNNGLELSRFPYTPPRGRPRRIVAVGRLVEKKGFDVLIDACALLNTRGVDVHCDVLGGGELEGALRARIDRAGLQQSVALLGPRQQAEVIAAVSRAAVLAVPCVIGRDGNRDGLPTVLLEAMALGTPCVSTDVTGIPEVVQHNRTGLIVRQNDVEELALAIGNLLGDEALQGRLATAARQEIEARFDSRNTAADLRQIFDGCVNAHAPAAVSV